MNTITIRLEAFEEAAGTLKGISSNIFPVATPKGHVLAGSAIDISCAESL